MIEQLWMAGVIVAFSIFGIKVGLGLSCQIYSGVISRSKKASLFAGALVVYLILFLILYYLVANLNLFNYLEEIMTVVRFGLVLHLIIATGLLTWGIKLLLKNQLTEKSKDDSYSGSLLLIMPCPVCATAIFLNMTFVHSISSLAPLLTTFILFGIFTLFIFITIIVVYPFSRNGSVNNNFLGLSMTFIALYFLLTLIITPIYSTIKDTFKMALVNNPANDIDYHTTSIIVGILILLISVGFIKKQYNKGEFQK